ncbi:hypothetical protein GLYMA_05G158250v4 [Glycine max]|nr:hypothetical protein GLYMA_05G158250v4 [Glycine max]KAH1134650.1 hypothetical protein GYH30_012804 [Glycine max]
MEAIEEKFTNFPLDTMVLLQKPQIDAMKHGEQPDSLVQVEDLQPSHKYTSEIQLVQQTQPLSQN